MIKFVGPTFQAELAAAGVPSGVWQGGDGTLYFGPGITPDQQQTALQVYAAHDPNAQRPPVATPYQIANALNVQGAGPSAAFDAALVKAKPSDRNRWKARTDPVPANNPVLMRVCAIAEIDPVALIALAVQQ